jgi:hypothetical protein
MKKAILLASLCCCLAPGVNSWAQDSEFRVVINMDNEIGAMEKPRISKIFLKKINQWNDGSSVEPVDQDSLINAEHLIEIRDCRRVYLEPGRVAQKTVNLVRDNQLFVLYASSL